MAAPSAVPICKTVLFKPEARPASCSATPVSAATVAVTKGGTAYGIMFLTTDGALEA
jgi:hypothetical protein